MINRRRGQGHFTIRHTGDTCRRVRLRGWMILPVFGLLVLLNITGVLNPMSGDTAASRQAGNAIIPVSPMQLQGVIDSLNSDQWGLETMDRVALLAVSYAAQPDLPHANAVCSYLTLLLEGSGPQGADQQLLQALGQYLGAIDDNDQLPLAALESYQSALAATQIP